MKAIKQLIFGKAASGEVANIKAGYKTTYPDNILPYNKWQLYISKLIK